MFSNKTLDQTYYKVPKYQPLMLLNLNFEVNWRCGCELSSRSSRTVKLRLWCTLFYWPCSVKPELNVLCSVSVYNVCIMAFSVANTPSFLLSYVWQAWWGDAGGLSVYSVHYTTACMAGGRNNPKLWIWITIPETTFLRFPLIQRKLGTGGFLRIASVLV